MRLISWCLATCLVLSTLPPSACAQSPKTLEAFRSELHVGTVEEALVGLEVINTESDGSKKIRHGNGLILRCDGFVAFPTALFSKSDTSVQTAFVTLYPGTPKAQRVRLSHAGYTGRVRGKTERFYPLPYAVFKLDDVHVPALLTLLPDDLKPQDELQIAWSAWDEQARTFLPVQRRAVTLGERPKEEKPQALGMRLLTTEEEGFLPGALVLGPEYLAVGLAVDLTAEGKCTKFASFQELENATNCVTALPMANRAFIERAQERRKVETPDTPEPPKVVTVPQEPPDLQRDLAQVVAASPDMVRVPGGMVLLPPILQTLQTDMQGAKIACVAPFLMDKYEVTNAQYLAFWKSLPAKQRQDPAFRSAVYPISWAGENAPFPPDLAKVPVLGVRLSGAKAYAKWVGKRLPTPYEWSLAAFGPTGGNEPPDWAKEYMEERQQVWEQIVAAHQAYAQQSPAIIPNLVPDTHAQNPATALPQFDPAHPRFAEFWRLPWYFYHLPLQSAAQWSKEMVEQATEPLFKKWVDPMYVMPGGSRPFDVSPYGIYDMVLNAAELVMPGPGTNWEIYPEPKAFFEGKDRYIEIAWEDKYWQRSHMTRWHINHNIPFYPGEGSYFFIDNDFTSHTLSGAIDSGDWMLSNLLGDNNNFDPRSFRNLFPERHTWRMLSRRLVSGSEKVRPNSNDYLIADIMDYVITSNAMLEISEMLRPVNDFRVNLLFGPTYDLQYSLQTRTMNEVTYGTPSLMVRKDARGVPRVFGTTSSARTDISDSNALFIGQTISFPLWNHEPRHFHREMGRSYAFDPPRPVQTWWNGNKGNITFQPLPDTFLIPGGFRCAR